jgi:hypothetical protein
MDLVCIVLKLSENLLSNSFDDERLLTVVVDRCDAEGTYISSSISIGSVALRFFDCTDACRGQTCAHFSFSHRMMDIVEGILRSNSSCVSLLAAMTTMSVADELQV